MIGELTRESQASEPLAKILDLGLFTHLVF